MQRHRPIIGTHYRWWAWSVAEDITCLQPACALAEEWPDGLRHPVTTKYAKGGRVKGVFVLTSANQEVCLPPIPNTHEQSCLGFRASIGTILPSHVPVSGI